MSWTEEKVAKLKELWGKGNTASQIAEIIGGISRNAVIGKAHRLNLSAKIKTRTATSNSNFDSVIQEKNIKSKNLEKISKQDIFEAFSNKELNIFDDSKKLEKFIKSFHFKNTKLFSTDFEDLNFIWYFISNTISNLFFN